ncbi:hypothetical protein Tco_1464119 [Tanacetum coccineum]
MTHPHPKRNFVPTAVATKSGLVPVNAAKQSSPRAAASISTARHVNIVALKQKVNAASPTKYSYFKAHSPSRWPFNQKSTAKTNNFNKKVYTAKVNNVTTAGPEVVGNPQYALQDQETFDSGYSRHMTGNKSYLTDYQDIDGGFVAFTGSLKGGQLRLDERKCNIQQKWMMGQDHPLIPNTHLHLLNSLMKNQSLFYNHINFKRLKNPGKPKKTTEISQSIRPIHLVADETVYKEWEDRMEKAATTASSLEAEQDSSNINKTQSMATLNESFP